MRADRRDAGPVASSGRRRRPVLQCETKRAMKRPNILILMVDQFNGTLFPDGPAEFLHAPHLKALAEDPDAEVFTIRIRSMQLLEGVAESSFVTVD